MFEPYRHQGDEEVGLVTVGLTALVLIAVCNGYRIAEIKGSVQLTLRSLWLPLALRLVALRYKYQLSYSP